MFAFFFVWFVKHVGHKNVKVGLYNNRERSIKTSQSDSHQSILGRLRNQPMALKLDNFSLSSLEKHKNFVL